MDNSSKIVILLLGLVIVFVLIGSFINAATQNLPGKPTRTPTVTLTPTANRETLMAEAVMTAEYIRSLTGTPTPTHTPRPTNTPTIPPEPTVTLAKEGLTHNLCENLQVDIVMKADILDAKGNIVGPEYDHDTNSCSYRFKEDGWLGDIIGYGTILLSIQEQEPGIASLTFYYKDTLDRAEQIVDWSAAILSLINPNTNVLAASNVIRDSISNTIAMSDTYTVYTQFDQSKMTVNIMIGDVEEIIGNE